MLCGERDDSYSCRCCFSVINGCSSKMLNGRGERIANCALCCGKSRVSGMRELSWKRRVDDDDANDDDDDADDDDDDDEEEEDEDEDEDDAFFSKRRACLLLNWR